jgi:hypothetical protein
LIKKNWIKLTKNMLKTLRGVMMFNTTFNNISVISWWSVLLMEESRVPGENHQSVASHGQTLSHNVVSSTLHHEQDLNALLASVVVNQTNIRLRPRRPLENLSNLTLRSKVRIIYESQFSLTMMYPQTKYHNRNITVKIAKIT